MNFVGCCQVRNITVWLGAFTTFSAFLLSLFASGHCDFMKIKSRDEMMQSPFMIPMTGDGLRIGLYSREELELGDEWSCVRWTEQETDFFWDPKYRTGVAFGFLANLFGLVCVILVNCTMCFLFNKGLLRVVALLHFVTGFFQALVFIVFATDVCDSTMYDCDFSSMAGVNVAACVLWNLAGCLVSRGKTVEQREEEEGRFEKGAEVAEAEKDEEAGKALPEQPATTEEPEKTVPTESGTEKKEMGTSESMDDMSA